MATAYSPPGVNVFELTSPSIAPLLAIPASICLLGLSAGVITRTDTIVLTGTTAITLPGIPTDATMVSSSIISVMDALDPAIAPSGYVATTDYTFSASAHTITRVGAGAIPSGQPVYVTYSYTPADYFVPIRLNDMADIQVRFGPAWDSSGTGISSILSHAALVAFENGASEVVLQPLFFDNAGTPQQPNATQAAASTTWASTLKSLRDIEDINLIIPVVGQSAANVGDSNMLAIEQTVQDHIKFMADQDEMIVGLMGEDSSASNTVAQKATLRTHADTLAARYANTISQDLVLIAPSKFGRAVPGALHSTLYVGGQYMAAALAGMIAAREVSASLTRKIVSGFTSVGETRTKQDMNDDASHGLLEVVQRGNLLQIRHALTLDVTGGVAARELSVVRSKHRMIESIRDTLETQVIGQVIADGDAPLIVKLAVIGTLELLRSSRDLVSFSDVSARTITLDPTTIEVRFSYRPAFPVNYINVGFTVDLTSGTITTDQTPTTGQAVVNP